MKSYKEPQHQHLIGIKEMPAEKRPRERMQLLGADSLSDIELLSIIIGSGTSNFPAHVLAQKVLYYLDQKSAKESIGTEELLKVTGIGVAKASLICAALELGRRRLPPKRRQITFPQDVFPLIRHYGSRPQEQFLSISLNGAHEVISINVISVGLVNHTLVHPREVFAHAISERATAIIVAHNHPSGLLKPSIDDITVTKRLLQAGELLGIRILDHLIFSEEAYRSMLEENELPV